MVGPIRGVETLPRESPAQTPVSEVSAVEAVRERVEESRQAVEAARQEPLDTRTVEPQSKGINFRTIDNPRVIQARVIDRESKEVLFEVPSTPRLRFAQRFRETMAEFVGQHLDVRA